MCTLRGLIAVVLLAGCAPDELRETPHATARSSEVGAGAGEAPGSDETKASSGRDPARARGLWVLAEGSYRVLADPTRIDPLLERAARLGVTDLFVQVYRGGRAFYAAGPDVERAPEVARSLARDVDVLATLIEAAHAQDLRVHAWVNVLSLSTRADASVIARLGREAILVDRHGRSLLDYPDFDVPPPDRDYYRMGTRGLYLDPAVRAVRDHLVDTFRDLLLRYPELDGLHLDYIRHPGVLPFSPGSRFGVGLEFGYGAESRARYRAETGGPDPIDGAPPGAVRAAAAWDAWRRHQVTTLVDEIAAASRATRPGIVLSAAVIAYRDRAYLSLAQDWKGWLERDSIDLAIPMVYTLDDRLLRYQLEDFAGWAIADRIWPGLGVWLFSDAPERAVAQLSALRAGGFSGEVLFSDDALATAPALVEALAIATPDR